MSEFSKNWTNAQSVNQQLWLESAYSRLQTIPFWWCRPVEDVVISYGFPNGRGRAGSTGGATYRKALVDGRHVIMIAPKQWTDPQSVMARLAHEMLHTYVNSTRNRHDGMFAHYARGYFLEPLADAIPSDGLIADIKGHLPTLPPFPASAFDPSAISTATTRNELYECGCMVRSVYEGGTRTIKGPTKVRHAGRTLDATCNRCNQPFTRKDKV